MITRTEPTNHHQEGAANSAGLHRAAAEASRSKKSPQAESDAAGYSVAKRKDPLTTAVNESSKWAMAGSNRIL